MHNFKIVPAIKPQRAPKAIFTSFWFNSILAPICDDTEYPNYKINKKKITNKDPDVLSVDSVDGFAMLINKNKFIDDVYFDESFFLYLYI